MELIRTGKNTTRELSRACLSQGNRITTKRQGALKLGDIHMCIIILAIITGTVCYAVVKMQQN